MCIQKTEKLLKHIEIMRDKLNRMLSYDNICLFSEEVLSLSQQLDILIVKYECSKSEKRI